MVQRHIIHWREQRKAVQITHIHIFWEICFPINAVQIQNLTKIFPHYFYSSRNVLRYLISAVSHGSAGPQTIVCGENRKKEGGNNQTSVH